MLFMEVPLYHLSHFSWFWELPLSAWKDWDKHFFVLLIQFHDCNVDPVEAERIERGDSKELVGICYPQLESFSRQTFLFWPKVSSSVSVLVKASWLGVEEGLVVVGKAGIELLVTVWQARLANTTSGKPLNTELTTACLLILLKIKLFLSNNFNF